MQLGSDIHGAIEHYLLYGWIRDDEFKKFVIALKPYLPTPDVNCFVELKIQLSTVGDLPWIGYVDLIEYESAPMRVRDYKSTSDFRYAKTPDELSKNTQLISYAEWCYQEGYVGEIELGHTYIHTRRKTPLIKPVKTIVDREHVRAEWNKRLVIVEKMIEVAKCTEVMQTKPTITACSMYGGCPHRARCGVIVPSPFKQLGTKGKVNMSFLTDLRKKQAEMRAGNGVGTAPTLPAPTPTLPVPPTAAVALVPALPGPPPMTVAPVPAPPVPEPTPVPTGVLAPDAPPRTTTPEEAVQIQEAAKGKPGRKKMTAAEKALRKIERDREKLRKAEGEARALAVAEGLEVPVTAWHDLTEEQAMTRAMARVSVQGGVPSPRDRPGHPDYHPPEEWKALTEAKEEIAALKMQVLMAEACVKSGETAEPALILYVDCMPTRNTEYTLFEDWFSSVADKIAEEASLPDYRLLPYAQEKAAVVISIKAQSDAGRLPSVMVVRSKSLGAQDALSALIPLASEIVRAVF